MSTFLGQHYDASLDIAGVGSREEIERAQIDRLTRALTVILVTQTIPRRLGGDATSDELALDKKRARRTAHVLHKCLHAWTKKTPDLNATDELRREGAQLKWPEWQAAYLTELQGQLRLAATFALARHEESWGKSAVVKLSNELSWVTYALRD